MSDTPPDPITAESRPGDGDAPAGVHDPARQSTARGALVAVLVAVVVLVAFEGKAVERAGERHEAGVIRTVLLAVGRPTGWVSDKLPFSGIGDRFNEVIGGSSPPTRTAPPVVATGGAAITADAFDPTTLGEPAERPRALRRLLVTGDSMATPLDAELARRLAGGGVRVDRDPRIGTSISQPEIVDWPRLAGEQAADGPDAVVVFLGANEGFPLRDGDRTVDCCGADWAAAYARSVRTMMATYRQRGDVRVYWALLPLPRSDERREVARAVNAGIRVAGEAYRRQVRVIDLAEAFTPGGRYRDAMTIDGRERVVRESDGIHLNQAGSAHAAEIVRRAIERDYGRVGG
ncbi:MAG: GDSL-type esterase/lipase family protein [Solirubrobacteraceae bacterium]|nr:GDSL-type esterase/lipase family protein [Solirubrobacteraceae bacterium]